MNDTFKDLEKLEDLVKAIEHEPIPLASCSYEITDRMPEAAPFLSAASREALCKLARTTEHADANDKTHTPFYISVTVANRDILEGIKIISADLNALSEKGLILSALSPFTSLSLGHSLTFSAPVSTVFSFVMIPDGKIEEARSLVKYASVEGMLGQNLILSGPDLKEGEFLADIQISLVATMLGEKYEESLLDDEIQRYLGVLPKGTVVVDTIKCPIDSLRIPYEVRFHNPLLKAYKKVALRLVRCCEMVDDKIVQFDLLDQVTYTRHDGTFNR